MPPKTQSSTQPLTCYDHTNRGFNRGYTRIPYRNWIKPTIKLTNAEKAARSEKFAEKKDERIEKLKEISNKLWKEAVTMLEKFGKDAHHWYEHIIYMNSVPPDARTIIFGMSTSQFEQRNWMKVILEHFCIQVFVQLTRVNNSMRCSWSREAHSSWDLKDSQSRMEGHDSWRLDRQNEARHWWHRSSTSIKGARHTQCANHCIPGLHEDHEQH